MRKNNNSDLLDWLGLRWTPDYAKARLLGRFLSSVFFIIILALVLPTTLDFFKAVTGLDHFSNKEAQSTAIRNTGLVLAAVIGVPFIVWRSVVAQKQVNVAEQSHITDQINKAVEGLGAEKVVRQHLKSKNGSLLYHEKEIAEEDISEDNRNKLDFKRPVIVELTQPNLEVRIGAIYALERIAQDSDRDHDQIMDILCTYARMNHPVNSTSDTGKPPFGIAAPQTPWPSVDIAKIVNVVGRRKNESEYRPDLRETHLQKCDFRDGTFDKCRFEHSNLSFSRFYQTSLKDVDFRNADISGAAFFCCDFTDSRNLTEDQISKAFFDRKSAETLDTGLDISEFCQANEKSDFYDKWIQWLEDKYPNA